MLHFLEVLDKKSDDCNEQRLELTQLIKRLEENINEKDKLIQSLRDALNQARTELSCFISQVKPVYASYSSENDIKESIWPLILSMADKVADQKTPATVKMSGFASKRMNEISWNSSFFYASEVGYQMRLRVDAAGFGDGKRTHVSIGLYLMNYDEIEQSHFRPLRGTFKIELLNQLNDSSHYSEEIDINQYASGNFVKTATEGTIGREVSQFISYTLLKSSNHSYLEDDALYFRISYKRYGVLTENGIFLLLLLFVIIIIILALYYGLQQSTANSTYS